MKKIGKFIKANTKLLAGIILGATVSGGAVYAATTIASSQVGYNNSTSGLAATDVQGALDELYQRVKILDNVSFMQTFNKSSLTNVGDSAILVDARDGNSYTVKKLADGNVWMTQNLRIINKTISSTDSNLPSGETYTVPASNLSSFTFSYNTNSAYLDSTYGGYYNFYTATAGWGTNSVTSGNSPKDICPKGWRLPTGDSSGEFQTLYDNYNSGALMQGEPNFTLSGNVSSGSVSRQGSSGDFWSSTVDAANYAYDLSLDSSNVFPTNYRYKYYGFSVRCMAI